MKNFFNRYCRAILLFTGCVLVILIFLFRETPWAILFMILIICEMLIDAFILGDYELVCKKCGLVEWGRTSPLGIIEWNRIFPDKYCTKCGGIMEFWKNIRNVKICKNGHQIEINSESDDPKYCPKRRTPLTYLR